MERDCVTMIEARLGRVVGFVCEAVSQEKAKLCYSDVWVHQIDQACGRCVEVAVNEPQVVIGGEKTFTFDEVFDSHAPQQEVYNKTAQPLLDSFFEGINVTIFAYGQTGSGKTFTMGTNSRAAEENESVGIIPRMVGEIFSRIKEEEKDGNCRHLLRVSFLEIHNDDIRDLLDPSSKVCSLREDNTGAVIVAGLETFQTSSADDVMSWLHKGSLNRATGSTCMNLSGLQSSRSHAVFTITMEKIYCGTAGEEGGASSPAGTDVVARLHLVDLAGSERAKRTKAEGQRLKEGININKGLLALGNVISALSEKAEGGANGHVPYRDSKLTRMLQDSLGGNSKTMMIACVSPADCNFEETLNTLKYANRAKNIKNKPVVNVSSSNAEVAALRAYIQQLEAQVAAGGGGGGGGGKPQVPAGGDATRVKELEEELRWPNWKEEEELTGGRRLKEELQSTSLELSRRTRRALQLEIQFDKLRIKFQGLCQQQGLSWEEEASFSVRLLAGRAAGEKRLCALKEADEKELQRMRQQVDELQAQLSTASAASKETEKLETLELQLAAAKKRVTEQEKMLRLKQNSDRRIAELSADIEGMKQAKVKLLRKMKMESDRFKEWRAQHSKEVLMLKRQQKQAEHQAHKFQLQLDKQQVVLKRKMEEAAAANMRLKRLLEAKSSKGEKEEKEGNLEQWFEQEISFCVEVRRIRNALTEQMSLRSQLHAELQQAKELLEQEEPKSGGQPTTSSLREKLSSLQSRWQQRGREEEQKEDGKEKLRARTEELGQQVQACSQQIGELQRQLLGVEGNNDRERNVALNCPHLRSIQDAKKSVRFLFSLCIKSELEAALNSSQVSEQDEEVMRLKAEVEELEKELRETRNQYSIASLKQEQQAEQKTLLLLSSMSARSRMQEEAQKELERKEQELKEAKSSAKPPKKKAPPKVEVVIESESSEEEEPAEEELESDDEWVPTAKGGRRNEQRKRRGRTSEGSEAGSVKGEREVGEEREGGEEGEGGEEKIPGVEELQAMKVPTLKELCGRKGLKKTGKKEELVARLVELHRSQTVGEKEEEEAELSFAPSDTSNVTSRHSVERANEVLKGLEASADEVAGLVGSQEEEREGTASEENERERGWSGEWTSGEAFGEALAASSSSSNLETEFSLAIEKMQAYIDLTARKPAASRGPDKPRATSKAPAGGGGGPLKSLSGHMKRERKEEEKVLVLQ
ncbi:hypothetical protein GUITHDRAFT_118111 [Guillardia theta CCMP2712]|uniref:Kinesin motor domain-containing protein n=1 Tax=Guillardia theta (strain CCMP2712) TaxID=905079 RepID=L1IHJ8_GUITC|nr:hypothetical protein GUITHDRAFT_118111 [Guillardia theta CCMP2712]EKX35726.1 hypothetical protein GUITHDRAFT_118111 [Guillardia theta CCMP2712]|eukprot:XP_005822706.1 hypothetical protein GUITHDRAFT_118111 [Guillardia theta CCMP2712]